MIRRLITILLPLLCSGALSAQPALSTPIARSGALEPGQSDVVATSTAGIASGNWTHQEQEVRGIWIASQDLLATESVRLQKLDAVTSANFNRVMVDCWFRGFTAYPGSKVAPQFAGFEGRDTFGWYVQEAKRRGLLVDAWVSYGFYAYYTPSISKDTSMGPVLDQFPDLAAMDSQGQKHLHNKTLGDFYSLCPSNPLSHEILGQLIVEVITRYPVDGLHLDRIRYPDEEYCYCPYCKEHFHEDTGLTLSRFAAGSTEAARLLQWKREQTVKAVELFRKVALAARPGLTLTAYVVGPAEMDSRGQGWDLWMKRGLLDSIAVSMYGSDVRQPMRKAIELVGSADRLIGAISCGQPTPVYLRNIEAVRTYKALGQMTWYVGDILDDVEGLRSGPYSRTAKSPFPQK